MWIMAAKKVKTGQEAKAPETHAGQEPSEGQAVDNLESGEGAGQDTETLESGEGAEQDTETVEDAPEKPLPKVLTALRPILYLARQYKVGDSLPVNNTEMVEAWIGAGSAEWREKKARQFFP